MTRHAVLIGCHEYTDEADFEPLDSALIDVREMSAVLSNPAIGAYDNIKVFDGRENHTEILSYFERSLADVRSTDSVLFYFSGHGILSGDQLHLAVHGTQKSALSTTSIPMGQVVDLVGTSRCQDAVLMVDCCYSGAARNAFRLPPNWAGAGFSIIASSTDIQTSAAKQGEETSIFTKFLLEGLETGDADIDNDGVITAAEAYDYAFQCVSSTGLQTPMEFSIRKGDIRLASNQNYVGPVSESTVPADLLRVFLAIRNMIEVVRTKPEAQFFVVLLPHYLIEGIPYPASGLTVSRDHTPNLRQSSTGLECDAFFPPEMLGEPARQGKEVVNGVIKVRMEVATENILIISGIVDGKQVDLLT